MDYLVTLPEVEKNMIGLTGHSRGGICLYAEGQLFTGDTLFVGDSGRTDLAGSNRPTLGASIRELTCARIGCFRAAVKAMAGLDCDYQVTSFNIDGDCKGHLERV